MAAARTVKPRDHLGFCPPSSGLAGICVFDPDRNCIYDSECASDYKCCSEGCGKICKRALGINILPSQ
ncbi:hypothetical protein ScPMuIL_002805 [Solemya velum]